MNCADADDPKPAIRNAIATTKLSDLFIIRSGNGRGQALFGVWARNVRLVEFNRQNYGRRLPRGACRTAGGCWRRVGGNDDVTVGVGLTWPQSGSVRQT